MTPPGGSFQAGPGPWKDAAVGFRLRHASVDRPAIGEACQNASAEITSPPDRLLRARQAAGSIESLKDRAEASPGRPWTPPGGIA